MYLYDHLLILAKLYKISLLLFRYILLFFILSFIFILEIGLSVCHTIQYLSLLTPVINFGLLHSQVILSMSLLETFTICLPLGKYKEWYPNTFGWNATTIYPCTCEIFLYAFRNIVILTASLGNPNLSDVTKKCQHIPNNDVVGYAIMIASNVQDQVALQCNVWPDDTLYITGKQIHHISSLPLMSNGKVQCQRHV
jgi:hypothetical protein